MQVHLECPATEASPLYLTRHGGMDHASINHSTRSPPLVQFATSSAVEDWPLHLMRGGEGVLEGVHNYATYFSQCLDHFQVVQGLFRFPAMEASTPYLMRRGGADRASSGVTIEPSQLS